MRSPTIMKRARLIFPALLLVSGAAWADAETPVVGKSGEVTTISADVIYTAAGDPIRGGLVAYADGKISAVSSGSGGSIHVAAITPGMIDLSVRIDTGETSVEQSDETPVHLSAGDALDFFSYRWDRELRSGVTTVLANPVDRAVLGGYGVVVKTGGEPSLEGRQVKANAVLRGSMGSSPSRGNRTPRGATPSSFYFRRPTTRMGVEWVARDAFWDAVNARKRGDLGSGDEGAQNRILLDVIDGKLPFSVQAWATQDIRTAIFLKEEFNIPHMFVDAAAEAWREPQMLVRSGMGVVLPPHAFNGRTTDGSWFAWDCASQLSELKVPFALSSHGNFDVGARLDRQAGFAMRGGLSHADALRAVTIQPARMVGIDDRVGSIEVGKDADLVLWNGTPFEATSRVIGVVLDGQLILDPSAAEEKDAK
ncbi:MAG: imidazolonepropionase-like amidohydrolase [Planctomycetota bacterium]|jgi:imidazolonepropionase-like amidohydrolase